ncbi:hypothetical protein G6F43_013320 [Rhizopus delemar]|nr:hypothetical protein G6F43_013320 [Rhizopus delemar]
MIVCYTTSTTNNEETAEGNIDETDENDKTEQDEQRVDRVECKKRLREAYETILMYKVPLDDLDQRLLYIFNFVISNNLTLESDVHLILSLNSILLLQNNNRLHKAIVPFFGNKLYTRIREHNLNSWNTTSKFPGNVLLKIIKIAQNVHGKTTDRIGASVSILNLASTMDDKINKRLIVSASQLLQSLSMDPTNADILETILINRYIIPLLQPLFDNDGISIQLDFTATELAEKCRRPPNFNRCPDCIISCFPHQTNDGINIGYGEVKKTSMATISASTLSVDL